MGEKRKDFVGKERLKKTIKRRKEIKRAARRIRQVGEKLVQRSPWCGTPGSRLVGRGDPGTGV